MILRPIFFFKDRNNTVSVILNSSKQKKLIFNFFIKRNWKKLTDSRKRAKILADNHKSQHLIETLIIELTPRHFQGLCNVGMIYSNFHHSYNLFLICLSHSSKLTEYVLQWFILATQFSFYSMSSLKILFLV